MALTLRMSETWLRAQAQRESVVEYHSPRWEWPVKKILNDSPLWNRHTLARDAKERRAA